MIAPFEGFRGSREKNCGARFLRVASSTVIALLATVLDLADARAVPKPRDDDALQKACARAEKLLGSLEFERAGELLESQIAIAARSQARPETLGRIWALLGWARAELGDAARSEEAFVEATLWHRNVALPSTTSPKIREVLERVRATRPIVPQKDAVSSSRIDEKTKSRRDQTPTPYAHEARVLRHRIRGEAAPGNDIAVVLEHTGFSPKARFELMIRRNELGAFRPTGLVRTGTTAKARIRIDRPRIDFWMRALEDGRVVATVGSESDPFVASTISGSVSEPSVSSAAPAAEDSAVSRVEKSAAAVPEVHATEDLATTSSVAVPTAALATTSSVTVPAAAFAPNVLDESRSSDDDLGTTGRLLITAGAILLVAGVVIAAIALQPGGVRCDAAEGFGCTEIRILPRAMF